MNWAVLGDIGAFLQGIAGVMTLVTVLFVLRQTREMIEQNKLSAASTVAGLYADIASKMLDMDMILFSNPHLKPYFRDNVAIDKESQHFEQVMSLAEMFVDFMDFFFVLERVSPKEAEANQEVAWSGKEGYIRDMFQGSPAIRRFWAQRRRWYPPGLAGMLDSLPNEYLREG